LFGYLAGWLIGWLVGWLVCLLVFVFVGWLVGWLVLGCMEAMLWLSGEPLCPYWDGMSMKVVEMPHGLDVPGHKVWVLPRGLRGTGHNMCVLIHGLGGLVVLKAKGMRGLKGFGVGFGALWGRGVT
jgi:hypothetical protein